MKWLVPKTVAGQLIAVSLIALAISQILLMVILVDERQSAMQRWWADYTLARVASVVELLDATPDTLHAQVIQASATRRLNFQITDSRSAVQNNILEENALYAEELRNLVSKPLDKVAVEIGEAPAWREILMAWISRWRGKDAESNESWLKTSVQLNNGKWLNLAVERRLRPPPLIFLVLPVLTMLLVFGSSMVLIIRHITQPMKQLARAAEALGRGEEIAPVAAKGPAEIRQAIEAFNDMRERLSRFVLDRTKMLAAVGHDLRTPITNLRLRAEFIEDDEMREKILSSLEEMQEMAEGALAFAREEAVSEETKMVDLNALLQTVCADQSDIGRDVTYDDNGRLPYRCRPNGLKRAVRNLVENAVIHGKSAHVHMNGESDGRLEIVVEDHGPGIQEKDMTRVFSPFVRLDEARGEATGGIGLGLAIARSIVRGHGGDITLENRKQGGLMATITLPRNA